MEAFYSHAFKGKHSVATVNTFTKASSMASHHLFMIPFFLPAHILFANHGSFLLQVYGNNIFDS